MTLVTPSSCSCPFRAVNNSKVHIMTIQLFWFVCPPVIILWLLFGMNNQNYTVSFH